MKIKSRIKFAIDNLLWKWGYTTRDNHVRIVRGFEARIDEIEKINLDKLVRAIVSVNMIRVESEIGNASAKLENYDPSRSVKIKSVYPETHWYQYRIAIDIPKLARIYDDLKMNQNSLEFEYLKRSVLHDIERNMDALMKVGL